MTPQLSELELIEEAMKNTKSTRMLIRYQVISLHLKGFYNTQIAEIVGRCEHTIGKYVNAYKSQGIRGLIPTPPPGAQRKLSPEQEQHLVEIVSTKTPTDVNLEPYMSWNSKLICLWVKQAFGITYTNGGMRDMLIRLGFSYTSPTYSLAKASKEKQEVFKSQFEVLKKLSEGKINHLLFQDESLIKDYQALCKTWFPKGKQRIIPTYGQHNGVKLLGVLDYVTGQVYVQQEEHYDAKVFLSFLENILEKYPSGKIVMILDNARIHHAKLIQPFLEENEDRLNLVFLPAYSPELNLIEGLWKWLKVAVIYNVFYKHTYQLKKAVEKFVEYINLIPQEVIDRLCIKM